MIIFAFGTGGWFRNFQNCHVFPWLPTGNCFSQSLPRTCGIICVPSL